MNHSNIGLFILLLGQRVCRLLHFAQGILESSWPFFAIIS